MRGASRARRVCPRRQIARRQRRRRRRQRRRRAARGGGSSDSALLALVVLCAVAAAALGLWRSPTAQARLLGHPLVLQLFSRKRGVRREADRVARTFGFGTADAEESLDAKDVA